MNRKALQTLEYPKIIDMLAAEAGCEGSREMARQLVPYEDPRVIGEELRSTTEAVDLIVRKGPVPTGGIYDIAGSLNYARMGGSLTMKQLLEVYTDLRIAADVVSFMKSEELPALPLIRSLTDLVVTVPGLQQEIDRCILNEDEMNDNASPKLRDIRREIRQQNESIRNRLTRIVNSTENRTYLQDAIVTMRDGRYVIPVKQEYRSRFPGMIHDQSKAGATLFIEPQAIVDMNNRLRELALEEEAEIARILAELSSRVAEHAKELTYNQKLMTRLDFLMAKGRLSRKMKGEEPVVTGEDGALYLRSARHPLIDPEKVVPIDVRLGGDFRTLIITGPNTGGKTVSLKTTGLLALMAQSGLHIPASSESTLPVFKEIFADIGDEQSIEQSLSTFSSHMKNIVGIIDKADYRSLVLVDELGAGTDPTEGAALAISILERLYDGGAVTMATTHYNELKKYALSTDSVENAAMEFDVDTLSPTYRLLIGVPGKSNAFEISRKLGLEPSVIDRASELIERGDMEFENVISSIEEDRKRAADERDEAAAALAEAKRKLEEIEKKERALSEKSDKVIAKAREEARDILRDAKETSRVLQKELRDLEKNMPSTERRKRFEKSRQKLREAEEKYAERVVKQVNSAPVSAADLKVGDRVKVLTLGQNGSVLTLPDDRSQVTVAVGAIKVNVNLEDLMLIGEGKERKEPAKSSRYGSLYKAKTAAVSASINVQGENLDDALMDVEKYLDDVYIAGLETVTIIHGRGEGILKNGIRQMLRKNKYVASFSRGAYNEGGEGVTIVKMKKN